MRSTCHEISIEKQMYNIISVAINIWGEKENPEADRGADHHFSLKRIIRAHHCEDI